ncbi:betaine/proline/choline family ABC transporter ATP-binding protein [Virgibacillus halophilus]|uniref:Quaternary amine transport ATP-binding protein n=1 Tax=Tigheibacillus halophilus TaxID=361280 RepID=A0ABU5C8P4_9BACI|nr:betaine/proline/choline family ABC transporter ATP-binding protein [Virgibacillus halophilus]
MLTFKNVSKEYEGGTKAVNDLNLEINKGEFIVFIGPSGCGKTTTMKMVNRLIDISDGEILIEGENIRNKDIVELRRSIGYVIQQIGLFPHMTIAENIALVPKLLKWPEKKRYERAQELLKLVNMDPEYLDRYPNELSGGQQQRIGVLRALAANPPLILMDEPFGALDPITKDSLQDEFKHLQKNLGKTIVFVTHDMDEAIKLADRIVIMRAGEIVQVGTPDEILRNPANEFVETFLGKHRLISERENLQTVEQIMNPDPIAITENESLSQAIKMMKNHRVDSLLVVDTSNHLKGVIDLEMIDKNKRKNVTIGQVMETEFYKVKQHVLLRDTVHKILRNDMRYAPVVDEDNHLLGIITRASIVSIVYDSIWGDDAASASLPV